MRKRYSRKRYGRKRRKTRGGSVYKHNTEPVIFEQPSTFWGGGDPRYTAVQPITNGVRDFGHGLSNWVSDLRGHYHSVDPDPLVQQLGAK